MSFNLRMDRLALHYVDRELPEPRFARTEKDVSGLHPAIGQFFLEMAEEIWVAPDQGATRSAKFVEEGHPRLKPSPARNYIEEIIAGTGDFFTLSKSLAQSLYDNTPAQVKTPGLLAIIRLGDREDRNAYVTVIKIRHDDKDFVRLLSDDLTELEVETVENMLLQGIQKGAFIPHPDRDDYHLKVIDKQARIDPAQYFTEGFLGCLAKKSDQYQATRLIPIMEKFARARDLEMAPEGLPHVIKVLQERDANISTQDVVDAVEQHEVFGDGFRTEDLATYIEEDSPLGQLDIPNTAFARRGKRAEQPRNIVYQFRTPQLRGLTVSGPPEVLERIIAVDGDIATFHVEVPRNGYRITYE